MSYQLENPRIHWITDQLVKDSIANPGNVLEHLLVSLDSQLIPYKMMSTVAPKR